MTGWFIWGWYDIYRGFKNNNLAEDDKILAARYMRMTLFICICMWGYLFLSITGGLKELYKIMVMLFRFGIWSTSSMLVLWGILIVLGMTIYFVIQWAIIRFWEYQ